jgi:hypothetical protein
MKRRRLRLRPEACGAEMITNSHAGNGRVMTYRNDAGALLRATAGTVFGLAAVA